MESGTWKLEAWKAMVGFFEKSFFAAFGAIVLPAVLGAGVYPKGIVAVGAVGVVLSGVLWVILIVKGYSREEKT